MKARACSVRISALEEIKLLLLTLKQRLTFTLASPKELLVELGNSSRFCRCRCLRQTIGDFDELGFDEAWRKALTGSEQALNKDDIALLMQFTSVIGKSDLTTQQQQLDELLHQLDLHIEAVQSQNADKQRMYISLGTLGGFIAAVILI